MGMLVLSGGQAETLFDLALPVEVMGLPADLAGIDRLLEEPAVLAPIWGCWEVSAREFGRPSIPMDRLVRLMVIKARSGWGYESLVREVSDSLHLRRFGRVNGHRFLPVRGHLFSPLTAMFSPRWWPRISPPSRVC